MNRSRVAASVVVLAAMTGCGSSPTASPLQPSGIKSTIQPSVAPIAPAAPVAPVAPVAANLQALTAQVEKVRMIGLSRGFTMKLADRGMDPSPEPSGYCGGLHPENEKHVLVHRSYDIMAKGQPTGATLTTDGYDTPANATGQAGAFAALLRQCSTRGFEPIGGPGSGKINIKLLSSKTNVTSLPLPTSVTNFSIALSTGGVLYDEIVSQVRNHIVVSVEISAAHPLTAAEKAATNQIAMFQGQRLVAFG